MVGIQPLYTSYRKIFHQAITAIMTKISLDKIQIQHFIYLESLFPLMLNAYRIEYRVSNQGKNNVA